MKTKRSEKSMLTAVRREIMKARKGSKITSREIKEKTGVGGKTTRVYVHYLRTKEGLPIASNGDGYWLAKRPAELNHPIAHMKSRARSISEAIRALKKTQQRMIEDKLKLF